MTALRIAIGGKEWQVACDDGQETHLRSLASQLDLRLKEMGAGTGRINEAHLMMLAALMLTDENEDMRRELTTLRKEIQNSSQSFETSKQIEIESVIATTIHDIAARVEAIANELERA